MEKHEPVIIVNGKKVRVEIGEIHHPMTDVHLIEWIEIKSNGQKHMKKLTPNCKPIAEFELDHEPTKIIAHEHCNLHGTWKSEWKK